MPPSKDSFDCILVLGAKVLDENTPSLMLRDRLEESISCYQEGASKILLMSGDNGTKRYDEVTVMRDYVIQRGISEEAVFGDYAGFSTYDSLYRAKEIFGAKKVLIISQRYHLYRALYIAEELGLEAKGRASLGDFYSGQQNREIREALARVKDFWKAKWKPKPIYLGEKISLEISQ